MGSEDREKTVSASRTGVGGRTGADVLLDTVGQWGTAYIFGCPGSTEVPVLDATVGREHPRFVLVPHEGVAVAAADGYARAIGRAGAVTLHANVGLANAVSQVIAAESARVPVVLLNMIKPRSILSHGAYTTARDPVEMVEQYTKSAWTTMRPEELREDLDEAFRVALQPPRGPVYLAIPQDLLELPAIETSTPVYPRTSEPASCVSRPSTRAVARAADLLAECRLPLILSGGGAATPEAFALVQELATLLGAGVCCEHCLSLDYNAYPTTDEHYLGQYLPNHPAVAAADVILAVGTRLFIEYAPPAQPWLPPGVPLIHLHDQARDIGRLYPPAVALHGDIALGLSDLTEALQPRMAARPAAVEWRNERVSRLRAERMHRLEREFAAGATTQPIKVTRLMQALAAVATNDTTFVVDAATSHDAAVDYLPRPHLMSFHASASGGNLGWGQGAALGIKMGAPGRSVIAVLGDGVFMFGYPALWVAARNSLPVVFVVINNGMYAAVKAGLLRRNGRAVQAGVYPATDISGVDHVTAARGFGVDGEMVSRPQGLEGVLERALAGKKPFLIEVMVGPEDVGSVGR
ncbi:MAG: thiamine pyrophosphate-binding protein [Actinobacteria bacterium]|nr:thiamine pyrophosphate-binding protein [Actinomycetota bacterium]